MRAEVLHQRLDGTQFGPVIVEEEIPEIIDDKLIVLVTKNGELTSVITIKTDPNRSLSPEELADNTYFLTEDNPYIKDNFELEGKLGRLTIRLIAEEAEAAAAPE